MPNLFLIRRDRPSPIEPKLYEPILCLNLQGKKETELGGELFTLEPGYSMAISHDVPVSSRVTLASSASPYLSAVLFLDRATLRSLYDDVEGLELSAPNPRSVGVHEADSALIDAFGRYLALANDPLSAKVLGPLVLRELHFRLLTTPHGAMFRRLLQHDSHASHIARAIRRIRQDFRQRLAVPELARAAGMSPSTFHHHFKAITKTTPLQYQKDLRLLEARRMLATRQSVTETAYGVGYESPTQFSREYARKFGVPPSAHRVAAP